MSEVEEGLRREPAGRGEWIKFGVLAGFLAVVIIGIAVLRPLIFNQIVPAVLGWNLPTAAVPMDDGAKPAVEATPDSASPAEPAAESEPETVTGDSEADDAGGENEVFMPGVENSTVDAEDSTAVETAVTHTVQRGENLTTIAERYGVTVEALTAANDIPNPNRITAGTVLQIPQDP